MKSITIIGANSYIARNLIMYLKKNYPDITLCLYDIADKQIDEFTPYKKINIMSPTSVKEVSMSCDIIFMFVGKTGSENGFHEYSAFLDINEKGLLCLLNEYVEQKSKAKIIFPSTRLVYKGQSGRIAENSEKEFKSIYAMNKYACENYLKMYQNAYGINYCIFRICVPYGTMIPNASSYGTAEFMLSKAVQGQNITLYGDGSSKRTLTYIEDLCNILIEGALSPKCINDIFNIGGEAYSLEEMAELIALHYNVKIEYVPWPNMALKIESGDTVFEDKKLRNILNYKVSKFKDWVAN